MAANRLFISYRRDDSRYATKLIYDYLTKRLGKANVFMDVASIEGGIDYLQVIRDTIASCDVCVAVIADNWWSASDASGARRLDDPSDLLRVELVGALRAGISVIPCIVDEAEFPAESELPEELRPLANRQQVNIAHRSFDRDTDVLIRAIREAFARAERQRRQARYERWQRQFVSPASAFARRKPVAITALVVGSVVACGLAVYAFGTRSFFATRMLMHERPSSISSVWLPTRGPSYPSPADWRDEVLYYLMPDRFSDGHEDDRPLLTNPIAARGEGWDGRQWFESGSSRWQGGTLAGIRSKLGYLSDLGITTIVLAPVAKQRGYNAYHGFSVQDFLDVDPHLGSRRDLVSLVKDAHRHHMRVFLTAMLIYTAMNWQYAENTPGGPITPLYTPRNYPFGAWLNSDGRAVAKISHPDDGVWPVELQDPDAYVRAGTDRTFESRRGDFSNLRRLNFAKVSPTMVALYSYWIALTDCDGLYLDGLREIPMDQAATFCRQIRDYAEKIGKQRFFIAGELYREEEVQAQYLARLGGSLDAVPDLGSMAAVAQAVVGLKSPAEYFRGLNGQSPMAGYRNEGKRTLLMIDSYFGLRRFSTDGEPPQQIVAAVAFQLFTPGIPSLYYGDEQALMTPKQLVSGFGDALVREAMFGPAHPRKPGIAGLASGDAGVDTALPGFGPFGTSGMQDFNTSHPAYVRISALTNTRRKYPALRSGNIEVRQVRSWGSDEFRDSGAAEIVAWTRNLGGETLVCIVNLNGREQRSADVDVAYDRLPTGSELTVVSNTKHAAEGRIYKGTHPVTSRLQVKTSGTHSYIEIRDLGPSEVLILAAKPTVEDTDFGHVANQYQQLPYGSYGSGASGYKKRKSR